MYDAIIANEGYTYCSYLFKTDEVASDVLKEKLCFGTAKQKEIDRITRKHGPDATNVYGRNPSEKNKSQTWLFFY